MATEILLWIMGAILAGFLFFFQRFVTRIDNKIDLIFAKFDNIALKSDLDKVKEKLVLLSEKQIKLETNCNNCKPGGKNGF